MDNIVLDIRQRPARQQPVWKDEMEIGRVRERLAAAPALVTAEDVLALRSLLARVAADEVNVVQAGDCAEDPAECTRSYVARKAGLLDMLGGAMTMVTHRPVVRAGRMAGQFAKPRSSPTEWVGVELPVYRGHMVNCPEPDPRLRQPDPARILLGYHAACAVMDHLGWRSGTARNGLAAPVWTSHEALLLDYELPMVRCEEQGRLLLTSTHWPWIGDRTRQVDGAHVALLAAVANPVACKVGPGSNRDELVALCAKLDPGREPGRLTLIARMGADRVGTLLPPLVAAVRAAGHPVIWLSDPMHGNTITTADGLKSRSLHAIMSEVRQFQDAVRSSGGVAGGLHLETTPDDVTECVRNADRVDHAGDKYTTLCDPRLNPHQALTVISAWLG